MSRLLGLVVALGTFHGVAFADHAKLETFSRQLTRNASELYIGAQRVVGPYPSYYQRYALEHIAFLHNSAHRFERVVFGWGTNDHAHDYAIHNSYRRLSRDVYYARQTFMNLFYRVNGEESETNDHSDYARLDQLLRSCEYLVNYDIRSALP